MNGQSFLKSRFSVPAGPEGRVDCHDNHMEPDARGRCLRCGHKLTPKPQHDLDARRRLGRWRPSDPAEITLSIPVTLPVRDEP